MINFDWDIFDKSKIELASFENLFIKAFVSSSLLLKFGISKFIEKISFIFWFKFSVFEIAIILILFSSTHFRKRSIFVISLILSIIIASFCKVNILSLISFWRFLAS